MRIFDSLTNKNWNGNGLLFDKDFLILKSKANIFHKIHIESGKYKLNIIGKKRSGNGRFNLFIKDGDSIIFYKKIEFDSKMLLEEKIEIEFQGKFKDANLVIERGNSCFGTVEIKRFKLFKENNLEEKIKELKAEKNKYLNSVLTFDKNYLNQKKKITFIIPYSIFGGAEVYILNILKEIDVSEYDIDILFLGKNNLMYLIDDPRIKTKLCRNMEALKGALVSKNSDYIVYYNRADIYQLLTSLKENNYFDSKLVEIYHSDFEWPGSLSKIKERRYIDIFFRVADSLGNDILGLSEDKKITIPVGINLGYFSSHLKNKKMRRKFLGENKGIIGTVARISPEKNIEYVISLSEKMKDYSFVIVGDGPLLKKYKTYVDNNNIENVYFEGYKKDVNNYYSIFDLFLLPSKIEGTPISILEAMASGVPVFASKVGAIPSIITDNSNGFFLSKVLAKDKQKIIDLLENISLKDSIIKNGINYVHENHNIKVNANKFISTIFDSENLYSEIEDGEHIIVLEGQFI